MIYEINFNFLNFRELNYFPADRNSMECSGKFPLVELIGAASDCVNISSKFLPIGAYLFASMYRAYLSFGYTCDYNLFENLLVEYIGVQTMLTKND